MSPYIIVRASENYILSQGQKTKRLKKKNGLNSGPSPLGRYPTAQFRGRQLPSRGDSREWMRLSAPDWTRSSDAVLHDMHPRAGPVSTDTDTGSNQRRCSNDRTEYLGIM